MKSVIAMVGWLMWATTGLVGGQEVSVKSLPPSVVTTVPESGSTNVDATTTTEIKVTFSKEMLDESWSWVQAAHESFPALVGNPKYLADQKTCVLDVKLEPKKTYVLWINSQKFAKFKDRDGNPAAPYLLVFQTKP